MDNEDADHGRLIEALTLECNYIDALTAPFSNFGRYLAWWNSWGRPWPVSPRQNPKGYKDIEYLNQKNLRHRIYGPAYISRLYKIEAWYKEGKLHRMDGPAYTHKNNEAWFLEGKLHRLDGPAVVEDAGPRQYWILGEKFSIKQYKWEINRRKRKGLL